MDASVHPDERRVSLRAAFLQRLEQVRRNVEIADAAAIGDLLEAAFASMSRLKSYPSAWSFGSLLT